MSIFSIILISIMAGWIVFATALAIVRGRSLRAEQQEHAEEQARSARYRAALQRQEKQVAAAVAQFESLQREYLELKRSVEDKQQALEERPIPMVMIDSLDLSGEIGTLLEHVARVATAVRSYSAYTRGHYGQESGKARYDLLWLADCLHTFDQLGKALAGGSQRALASACEELLSMYDMYLKDSSGYDSRDTFRRLSEQVPLAGVTDAIRSIMMKTAAAPAAGSGGLAGREVHAGHAAAVAETSLPG